MTKEKALEKLLEEYPNGSKYEQFFRDTIERFAGDSRIIDSQCFEKIQIYLNKLT